MDPKSIEIEGKKVSYFDEGNGTPLVMVHGWVVCKYAFEPLGSLLSSSMRVIIPDLPGHGDSEELDGRHTLANYVSFLDKFLSKLGVREANFLGTSLGGSVCILYARKGTTKVNKLILQAPVVANDQLPGLFDSPPAKLVIRTLGNIGFLQNYYHDRFKNYVFSQRLPRLKGHLRGENLPVAEKAIDSVLDAFKHKLSRRASSEFGMEVLGLDLWESLCSINNDTLVLWGEGDTTLDKKTGRRIASEMSHATYVEIPNSSHDVVMEKFNECAGVIGGFINDRLILSTLNRTHLK